MDFFARQDQARRRTFWLVVYFTLSVLLTISLVYVVFALLFLGDHPTDTLARWWHFPLFAAVTAGTLLVVLVGNLTKIAALSQGGAAVARLLGGVPVPADTSDPDQRKLLNVVEEMAIASGTPVPEVYLLPREPGINAFAAGRDPRDAAIGVTQGCIQLLSRDELQGVIAHEFSHILNGDMRLNLRLIGIVHGLLCIALVGRILLQASSRSPSRHRPYLLGARSGGKGGNPLPLIGLALLVVGSIGVFFGRLIKSAVSRQREFLADAAAVQFTRHPQGLSGALQKIGGLQYGSRLQTPRAEEASHLYFGNGLAESWFNAFATHPPLVDRIRAIDPSFNGTFPRLSLPSLPSRPATAATTLPPTQSRRVPPPRLDDLLGPRTPGQSPLPPPLPAGALLQNLGHPQPAHLDFAVLLLASLPALLGESAREPMGATALVCGLLLSRDQTVRRTQLEQLQNRWPAPSLRELERLLPAIQDLAPIHRLPLVELALPALRRLSPAQYQAFREVTQTIIETDRRTDLFEFALQKMLWRHLAPHFIPAKGRAIQFSSLKVLLPDAMVLLSALAQAGHPDPAAARRAFQEGWKTFSAGAAQAAMLPEAQCDLGQLDPALDRFAQSSPALKKAILTASVQTISSDGQVQVQEAELLRAVADSLDCPMPPLLPS